MTELNPTGTALAYSSLLGGTDGFSFANALALDSSDNVYVTGYTIASNFATANPLQAAPGGAGDAFVTKIGDLAPDVTAVDDSYTTIVNTPTTLNVLANDTNSQGTGLQIVSTTPVSPSGPSLTQNANGTLTYSSPDTGVYTFDYTATGAQQEVTAGDGTANDNFGDSVAISGDTAVIGADHHKVGNNVDQGAVYVFTLASGKWTLQQEITDANGAADEEFGDSVSISGDTLVTGAMQGASGLGAAFVYTFSGGTWSLEQELTASDGAAGDRFGNSVAISGATLVVGAPDHKVSSKADAGAAYVYALSGETWSLTLEVTASDGAAGDQYGCAVATDGDLVVVGAVDHTVLANGQGAVYAYVLYDNSWLLQQELTAADGAPHDAFGASVAVDSYSIVVGAPDHKVGSNASQGAAYVYALGDSTGGSSWTQQQELTAADGAAGDGFGDSVAVDGDTVVVGAADHAVSGNANRGAAYVYTVSAGAWSEQQELTAADGVADAFFGQSVALSGETAVVGAIEQTVDDNSDQGAAYFQDVSTSSALVTVTVDQPPAITSRNNTTFIVGDGSFTVQSTGFPAPALNDGDATLPNGVTFRDNGNGTATLAGTPAPGTGGTYPVTITASNDVGNNATQSFTLTVDQAPAITSAADTTFTVGQAGSFTVDTSAFPAPALSDGGFQLPAGVTFHDNGNGTATLAGTPTGNVGGTYSFTITADNGVGSDATQTFTLSVDQAPAITSADSTTFAVGRVGSFTVQTTGFPIASLNDGNFALPSGMTFTDNGNGTATLAGTPAAATDGTYTFTITAGNGIGTNATQSFMLTVDQAPAVISAAGTTFTVGAPGSFTVNTTGFPAPALSDGGFELPVGVTFRDNGNGTATLAGTPAGNVGGTYAFTITAGNGVGSDATQTFTLTVDQAPAIASADNTTFTVGQAGSFTVQTTGVPIATLNDGDFPLPSGVTFTDNGNGTATLAGTPGTAASGTYTFTITASNGVGNNAMQTFTLTVDQAPAITSANNATFSVGPDGTFTVQTTGLPLPGLSDGGFNLPSGVTFHDNGDGTATLAGTPAAATGGTYSFTITADNGVGSDATQSFTLSVDQAPAITSADNTTFTVGQGGSFTVNTTGFPAPALSDGNYSLPAGVTFTDNANGTATLAGTPAGNVGGTYSFTITADNGVGSDAAQTFTLTVDQAPAVISARNTTFTVGHAGTFTVKTAGFPVAALDDGNFTLPSGVTFQENGDGTATLAGTPATGTGGTYTFTITASNGVGSDATQTFTLSVDQAPAITSADNTTFTVGQAGSFTVNTTGFPTPALADGNDSLPAGVTFTDNANGTATLAGTPGNMGGTYTVTITADNGVGNDATQTFTLTVDQAPAITSADRTTFTVGQTGSFTVQTTGVPVATLNDGNFALPSGVTFHDNGDGTATLAGTPAAATGGTYTFTITASNGVGSDATQTFTLSVDQAPAITSADNTTFTVGQAGSFTVNTTGFPAPALSDGNYSLPAGVTFTDNGDGTATLAGTPTGNVGGTYSFTITADNSVGSDATQTFALSVDQAPAITSADSTTFSVGQAGSFTVQTTGFPVATLNDGTFALPSGVTFHDNGDGTATLAGTPAAATGGTYTFTITADNGVGSDTTQTFTLSVDQAPAITSTSNTTFTVGQAGSFTVNTTGFPAPRCRTAMTACRPA